MSCNPLISPGICSSHKKNNGQCLIKAIPLAIMKNSSRKPVNSALCSGSQAGSFRRLYLGTTEAPRFSPERAQPSSCCPAAPWWTVHESQPSHEYLADEQIITAASNRAVLRGYQTFAEHRNNFVFLFAWTKN